MKYIFFEKVDKSNEFKIEYKVAFKISTYSNVFLIGIHFDSPAQGVGNVHFISFIFTKNKDNLLKVLRVNDIDLENVITCGNIKFLYSFVGNKKFSKLPYPFAGNNQNTKGGLSLLNNFKQQFKKDKKKKEKRKYQEESKIKKDCNKDPTLGERFFKNNDQPNPPYDTLVGSCNEDNNVFRFINLTCYDSAPNFRRRFGMIEVTYWP